LVEILEEAVELCLARVDLLEQGQVIHVLGYIIHWELSLLSCGVKYPYESESLVEIKCSYCSFVSLEGRYNLCEERVQHKS
jgi:hypothetical protein